VEIKTDEDAMKYLRNLTDRNVEQNIRLENAYNNPPKGLTRKESIIKEFDKMVNELDREDINYLFTVERFVGYARFISE
jgi:hypothetical protein